MNSFYKKNVTVDDIQFYITKHVDIVPALYDHFLNELEQLERHNQVSCVPITIFQQYHRRIDIAKTTCQTLN